MFIIQTWGLIAQNKKISRNGSEALSVLFFSGQFLYLFGYINYGLSEHNLTITISSLPGLFFLPIIYTLICKRLELIRTTNDSYLKIFLLKNFKNDLVLSILFFIIIIPTIFIITDKNTLLIILLITVIISILPQIYRIIKYKTLKNIANKYLLAMIISSLLYLIYGISMEVYFKNSWGLIVTATSSLIAMIIALIIKQRLERPVI